MLRASSETAVATFTEANLERPIRTASLHASRRAVAMSFSCSIGIFFGASARPEGGGDSEPRLPAAPEALPGESARAHEAMSCELLLRANRRTEFSGWRMIVSRSAALGCWSGVGV